jgi:hypothetical protein
MIRLPLPLYMAADAVADAAVIEKPAEAAATVVDDKADKSGGTALDLPPEGEDKKIVAPADFPDDWRAKMAGDDKAALKRLERFKTPADLAKSYLEADKKLTSGKVGTAEPAPDGTKDPDGLKAWREANGIPADPTGYELPKPVLDRMTDADKPVLASFTEFAHKANLPPSAVQVAANWYVEQQEAAFEAQQATDAKLKEEVQDELRAEYGQEFRANTTMAKRLAEEAGVPDLLEARIPNEARFGENAGKKIGNVLSFVKGLVDIAAQKYGDVSFAGGEAASKTQSEREQIETVMNNDFAAYDGNAAMKKRYAEILAADEKRKK